MSDGRCPVCGTGTDDGGGRCEACSDIRAPDRSITPQDIADVLPGDNEPYGSYGSKKKMAAARLGTAVDSRVFREAWTEARRNQVIVADEKTRGGGFTYRVHEKIGGS